MQEFNTFENVKTLFGERTPTEDWQHFFVAYKDLQKSPGGIVGGMEYPYQALLIGMSSNAIGYFYLNQNKIAWTFNIEKMFVVKESYQYYTFDLIDKVTIKNHAIFNKNVKDIKIRLTNGMTHHLNVKLNENVLPYQTLGISAFMDKYSENKEV